MHSNRGFTLLEVLISLTIASLTLAVLFQGTLTGLHSARVAERYEEAVARAQSHLAALDSRVAPLVPGEQNGDDGSGFHWHTQVAPLASTTLATPGPGAMTSDRLTPVGLYRVSATITWQDGNNRRQVTLDSKRVAVEAGRP